MEEQSVSLSDFRGSPVMLNFWALRCPYCVDELPLFQQVYEQYHQDRGVEILAANIASVTEIQKLGGDPAEYQAAVSAAKVDVVSLTPPPTYDTQRIILGVLAGILIFIALQINGQFIAQGVVEEKSTRVVELLLSTVKPWQLISGKVVGIDRIAVMSALNMAHEIIASGPGNDSETESCSERIRQLNSRIAEALDNCKATGLN